MARHLAEKVSLRRKNGTSAAEAGMYFINIRHGWKPCPFKADDETDVSASCQPFYPPSWGAIATFGGKFTSAPLYSMVRAAQP
jgi:hypothetical protein